MSRLQPPLIGYTAQVSDSQSTLKVDAGSAAAPASPSEIQLITSPQCTSSSLCPPKTVFSFKDAQTCGVSSHPCSPSRFQRLGQAVPNGLQGLPLSPLQPQNLKRSFKLCRMFLFLSSLSCPLLASTEFSLLCRWPDLDTCLPSCFSSSVSLCV